MRSWRSEPSTEAASGGRYWRPTTSGSRCSLETSPLPYPTPARRWAPLHDGPQMSRSYEELEVGDVYRSRFGRTVLEADNTWFTLLTMNTNAIHFDVEYAAATEWGRGRVWQRGCFQ